MTVWPAADTIDVAFSVTHLTCHQRQPKGLASKTAGDQERKLAPLWPHTEQPADPVGWRYLLIRRASTVSAPLRLGRW